MFERGCNRDRSENLAISSFRRRRVHAFGRVLLALVVFASILDSARPVQAATRARCSKISEEFAICSVTYTLTKSDDTRVAFEVRSPNKAFYLHVMSDGTGDFEFNEQEVLLEQKVRKKQWCGFDSLCGHPRKFEMPTGSDQAVIQITNYVNEKEVPDVFLFSVKDPFTWDVAQLLCEESNSQVMGSLCMSSGIETPLECLEGTEFLDSGVDHRPSDRRLIRKWYSEKVRWWAFFLLSTTVIDKGSSVQSRFFVRSRVGYDVLKNVSLASLIVGEKVASAKDVVSRISAFVKAWVNSLKGFDSEDWEFAEAGIGAIVDTRIGDEILRLARTRDCAF